MSNDPFADPAPIPSEFPNAAAFRGRVICIQPTGIELDLVNDAGKKYDKVTANITLLDDLGPVQLMPNGIPSGQFLDGPAFEGVWLDQGRVTRAVCPDRVVVPGRLVIGRLETFKPGQPAKKGNPWGLLDVTPAERAAAATKWVALQTAAASAAMSAPAKADENPF